MLSGELKISEVGDKMLEFGTAGSDVMIDLADEVNKVI